MGFFKRLYFDDGTSRKRWHVRLTGKSQVVEYGRLGSTLRETKKKFASPGEARASTEKLVAAKKREGYVEINPELLEITRDKGRKAATESQIASLEKRLNCQLPEEYRTFLLTTNGGRPNPPYVQIPGIPGIDNVGAGVIFGLFGTAETINSLAWAIQQLGESLPAGHLPVAWDSDLFTLSLRKKDFGCIHFWFHETDEVDDDDRYLEIASHLLAGSFDEFLTRIAMMFGPAGGEDASNTTGAAGGKKPAGKATRKALFRLLQHEHTPAVVDQIESLVRELGDLSGIQDGEWPFQNIDNARVLRSLLDAGLNPEILDTERQTLLWQCASSAECVEVLLKYNVKLDRKSSTEGKETALMRAIFVKSVPGVKKLLAAGANPTLRLPWWIARELNRNAEIAKLMSTAVKKWKK
jgi:predicted DNA-binding WGR domain protein